MCRPVGQEYPLPGDLSLPAGDPRATVLPSSSPSIPLPFSGQRHTLFAHGVAQCSRGGAYDFSGSPTTANSLCSTAVTSLSPTQVRHIATLARLTLTHEEEEKFAGELTSILNYIAQLQEVDTFDTKGLTTVTGLSNVVRPDTTRAMGPLMEDLLHCSPLPIVEHQIQTHSAHSTA